MARDAQRERLVDVSIRVGEIDVEGVDGGRNRHQSDISGMGAVSAPASIGFINARWYASGGPSVSMTPWRFWIGTRSCEPLNC